MAGRVGVSVRSHRVHVERGDSYLRVLLWRAAAVQWVNGGAVSVCRNGVLLSGAVQPRGGFADDTTSLVMNTRSKPCSIRRSRTTNPHRQ